MYTTWIFFFQSVSFSKSLIFDFFFVFSTGQEGEFQDMIKYKKEILCGKSKSQAKKKKNKKPKHLSCFYIDWKNTSKYFCCTANKLFISRDLMLYMKSWRAKYSILWLQEIFLLLLGSSSVISIWTQKSTFPSVLRLSERNKH